MKTCCKTLNFKKVRLYPTAEQAQEFDIVTREYQRLCNIASHYAYLNRPNRVETTYEVDVTKLPQYPKIKQAIKRDLAVLGQKLEDQVLQPDLAQIVDYIMQNGNPNLVSYLPITVHENYSNKLLENAMDK